MIGFRITMHPPLHLLLHTYIISYRHGSRVLQPLMMVAYPMSRTVASGPTSCRLLKERGEEEELSCIPASADDLIERQKERESERADGAEHLQQSVFCLLLNTQLCLR